MYRMGFLMESTGGKKNLTLEIVIATAAFLVCLLLSSVLLIAVLILPIMAAFIAARHDIGWIVAFFVVATALLYLFFPSHWWAFAIMLLVSALPCGLAIRNKINSYDALVLSVGGWLLAAAAMLGYVYLSTGTDILTYSTETVNEALKNSEGLTSLLYVYSRSSDIMSGDLTQSMLADISFEEMLKYVSSKDIVSQLLSYYIPVAIMGTVVVGGFLQYLITRAVAKSRGSEVAYIPSFDRFYLPKKVSKYFLILYIVSLLPSLFGIEALYLAGYALSTMIETVFLIQGISFIEFLLKIKLKNKGLRIFLDVVISLFLSGILIYVGLIEQIIRLREANFILKNKNGGNN